MWHYTGQRRPDDAVTPGPGQESVWDYPRPPRLARDARPVRVTADDGSVLADAPHCVRILETASPPTVYVAPEHVHITLLEVTDDASFCEWKGPAQYWRPAGAGGAAVGWCYPRPRCAFATIAGWFCFYPERVACTLGGEHVRPQGGGFYGGWVTDEIVGPWKGGAGTAGW